jgi:lactate dehydrogenase-like 2-hydroxyacid dehydrogenase
MTSEGAVRELAEARSPGTLALVGPGADVLVLALPHTPQTAGLITPELLRTFDGVHLVNIGRGSAIRAGPRLLSPGALSR